MRGKPVIPRAQAREDAEDTVDFYLEEGAAQAAIGFVDELEYAYSQLARHPNMGSLRYAYELNIPELRSWALRRYPHLVFYVERPDHIDVWRVINGSIYSGVVD